MEAVCALMKILQLGSGDVHEDLRVAVHKREPVALHMHHNEVASTEGVADVGNLELDLREFVGLERIEFLEAVAELPTEDTATNELLVAAHRDAGGMHGLAASENQKGPEINRPE